jgi:gamma-glutamyl hercynylcysteine S-oxide synthase
MMTIPMAVDRHASLQWFRRNRERSARIFGTVREAYYDRPIPLRNPICFYEGHIPAFGVNTLIKRALGKPGIDGDLEVLFERGIDPEDTAGVPDSTRGGWPERDVIRRYAEDADRLLESAIEREELDRRDNAVLRRGLALYTVLEHEPMHQETLGYIWHRLPYERKTRPPGEPAPLRGEEPPRPETVRVPAGRATLGADRDAVRFGWDNEFPAQRVDVAAFEIDRYDTTNAEFLEFVEAGGYRREDLWSPEGWSWRVEQKVESPMFWERRNGGWDWRGMWERIPLPPAWPVYVSHAEASAYARWKKRRLPTEAEFHRAAYGTPEGGERPFPWGEEPPDSTRGNFDFRRWDPVPVGSHPAGASAWGVHDLVGNGWEWTSTEFAPFPGFEPMASYPVYSTDFFDGKHYVLKGASPATAKELVRASFRNWFRGNYPYVYATFRCVSP